MRWFHIEPSQSNPFIFSVTVGAGQAYQLPTLSTGTYDYVVDWGDSSSDSINVWNAAERTHTYTDAGTYDISITGTFNGWSVNNNATYRSRLTEIKRWGILKVGSGQSAFRGANNMTITATDILDTSSCTTFSLFFLSCSSLTNVPNIGSWNVSNVTNFQSAFAITPFNGDLSGWDVSSATSFISMFQLSNFNSDISSWDTSSCTNMSNMFSDTPFNQDISSWQTGLVTTFQNMFVNCPFDQDISSWNVTSLNIASPMLTNLSTANYDALLIGWESQSVLNVVPFGAGTSTYTSGGLAEAARSALIADHSWSITDGGPV